LSVAPIHSVDWLSGRDTGRWISQQRDIGQTWAAICEELDISASQARRMEKSYLAELAAQQRREQHTLW
jgi:hypothetical protein